MPGKVYTLGVCSQSGVKTQAIGQHCADHGISSDNIFYIKRSTPPQAPKLEEPDYQEKQAQYEQELESWKTRLPNELSAERDTLARAGVASENGDVAVIYCLNTNAITVNREQLSHQPTAVKEGRLSRNQLSEFIPNAKEFNQLVVGMQYAEARTAAFNEIAEQLATHHVPLGSMADTIYAIESIGEVDKIGAGDFSLDATSPLRDIACMAIHDTSTGATLRGSSDALILPEEVKRMVYEGAGNLTIGKAISRLFYREPDGELVPVVRPEHHQDPHRDMCTQGNDRQAVITRGLNALTGGGNMDAIREATNAKNGEIIVSPHNLPFDQAYLDRLEKHRAMVSAWYQDMAAEYAVQQERGGERGFAGRAGIRKPVGTGWPPQGGSPARFT